MLRKPRREGRASRALSRSYSAMQAKKFLKKLAKQEKELKN